MCGFIGVVSRDASNRFPEDKLRRMNSLIAHRGPDDEGFYFSDWLSLAFRRLKIIDLSEKGHQPMFDIAGTHVIVFNGEIYNYKEIRDELIGKGFKFRSDSDTEVLLNSYLCWGKDCLHKFIGMFAFIIADLSNRTLFFARDQLGIKPLFICETPENIFFSSEIKALIPAVKLEPDYDSIKEYLVFRSLPGENTMFKNVCKLGAGHFGFWRNGVLRTSQYFNLAETLRPNSELNFESACAITEDCLSESIRLHLRSDVELGVQLSGGVDSSLVTALASKISG
ncbi:MAG: asparagine synthase (glutamine-hydrolyzing), partial [Candidatus Nanoarchaeia archaeon]